MYDRCRQNKSNQYFKASKEGADFLALAEPIKIGHHSESRHRALIERNWNRIGKAVAMSEKAEAHESKADYWEKRASDINLSMPESIEYYEYKLEDFNGIEAFVVRVPYEKDIWYFYLHPETYGLMAYKFYKDEEKKIGEIILLKEEVIVGEMKIPSERSWYRTENEEFLGTDFLLKTEDNVTAAKD